MSVSTRRLPLTALRTFEAAARHLSFKDAAEELCVSATTVSNQIRQLEKDCGFRLFDRHTRAVTLTDTGRSLANVLTGAFDDIRAELELHLASQPKTVTIAVGPIFGSRWLGPRLSQFGREHPGIDLVVHHGTRITGAEQLVTDLVVDWGTGVWHDLDATKLLDARYSPVISPEVSAEMGPITEPAQLAGLTIIHQHDRSEWRNWFALAGCPDLKIKNEIVVVDSNMVQRAVKDGQGAALGVFPFMDAEVRKGQMVKPFDIDLAPSRAFFLLCRRGALSKKSIRTVHDWIVSQALAEPQIG